MADEMTSYIQKYKDTFGTVPEYKDWEKANLIDPYDIVVNDGKIRTYWKKIGQPYNTEGKGIKHNKEVRQYNKAVKRLKETYGGDLMMAFNNSLSGQIELTTQMATTDKILGDSTAQEDRKEETKLVYIAIAALVIIFLFRRR